MRVNKSELDFPWIQRNRDETEGENSGGMRIRLMSGQIQMDNDDVLCWTMKSSILECSKSLFSPPLDVIQASHLFIQIDPCKRKFHETVNIFYV